MSWRPFPLFLDPPWMPFLGPHVMVAGAVFQLVVLTEPTRRWWWTVPVTTVVLFVVLTVIPVVVAYRYFEPIGRQTAELPVSATGIPGPGIHYTTDSGVTALHEDRTTRWTLEGRVSFVWQLPGESVAVLEQDRTLTVLDADGHVSWTRPTDFTVVAADEDLLVLSGPDENTWTGVRITDGTPAWTITGPEWGNGEEVPGLRDGTVAGDLPSAFLTGNTTGGVEARSVATGQVVARAPDAVSAWLAHDTLVTITEQSGTCTAIVTALAEDRNRRTDGSVDCSETQGLAPYVVGDTLVFNNRLLSPTTPMVVIGLTHPATTRQWCDGAEQCLSTGAGVELMVPTYDLNWVTGIDPTTGHPLWHIDGIFLIQDSLNLVQLGTSTTTVFIEFDGERHLIEPASTRRLVALDPTTGRVLVSVPTGGNSPIVVGDGWFITETVDLHGRSTTRLITVPGN